MLPRSEAATSHDSPRPARSRCRPTNRATAWSGATSAASIAACKASRHSLPASVSRINWSHPASNSRAPFQSNNKSGRMPRSDSPNRARCAASKSANTMDPPPRRVTFAVSGSVTSVARTKLLETLTTPGGSCPAMLLLNACPSTRCAAATTDGGNRSRNSGSTRESGLSATPRSSTPAFKRNRPTTESSLVVKFENVIAPVFLALIRNVADRVSPGAIVPNSTRGALSNNPPLILLEFNSMLIRFAAVEDVFKIVTTAS